MSEYSTFALAVLHLAVKGGKTRRAQIQVTFGLRAEELSNYIRDHESTPCRSTIVWTLFMLGSVFGSGRQPGSTAPIFNSVPVCQRGPAWAFTPAGHGKPFILAQSVAGQSNTSSTSVATVTIELLSIWSSINSHLLSAAGSTNILFWRHDSPRAELITRLTDFELSWLYRSMYFRTNTLL